MEQLKYKDFYGSAEIDLEASVCRGKLLFIDDLVTYQADTVAGLKKEFENAVEDYLVTCVEVGKAPQKAFTGVFNVRISPQDHRAASLLALKEQQSLNSFVSKAIHTYLQWSNNQGKKIELHHKVEIIVKKQSTFVASAGDTPSWHKFDQKTIVGKNHAH